MYLELSQSQLHELELHIKRSAVASGIRSPRAALKVRASRHEKPELTLYDLVDEFKYQDVEIPRVDTPLNSVNLYLDYVHTLDVIEQRLKDEYLILSSGQVACRIMMALKQDELPLQRLLGIAEGTKLSSEMFEKVLLDNERGNPRLHARFIVEALKDLGVGFQHQSTIYNHNPLTLEGEAPFVTRFPEAISFELLKKSMPFDDSVMINQISVSGKTNCTAVAQGLRDDAGNITGAELVAYHFKDPSSDSFCFVEGADAKKGKIPPLHMQRIENALNRDRQKDDPRIKLGRTA